jgi:NhaP-type Na+/H+ or K+/H+ antiporter
MELAFVLIGIGALVFAAYLFSELFARTNIPDVLPLFLIGLLLGPITGIITPALLNGTGELIATFTLIGVLFVGGLNIEIAALIRSFSTTFALMFLNLIGTAAIITLGAY